MKRKIALLLIFFASCIPAFSLFGFNPEKEMNAIMQPEFCFNNYGI